MECATKVARTVKHLRKGKEFPNLAMNNCVQHLSRVLALSKVSAHIVKNSVHLYKEMVSIPNICLGCCQRVNYLANRQPILHVCAIFMRVREGNARIIKKAAYAYAVIK